MRIGIADRCFPCGFPADNVEVVCSLDGLKKLHELFQEVDERSKEMHGAKADGYLWHQHLQHFIKRYDRELYSDIVVNIFQ